MKPDIKTMFKAFESKNIVVIGDVMIDSYLWGKVDRISPEAPVPVVTGTKNENRLGGAANVALNIKSLGGNPILCSVIGKDDKGILFYDIMHETGLSAMGIIQNPSRKTTAKTRIISGNQHLLRIDEEIAEEIPDKLATEFSYVISHILKHNEVSAIVFEDYNKGVITKKVISEVIETANKMKIPVLVDPKKNNFFEYKNIAVFKPNLKELSEGMNVPLLKNDFEAISKAARQIQNDNNIELALVTLSEFGILVSDANSYFVIPAEVRDIADVCGAGDTVISAAALGLAAGLNPRDMAAFANTVGGLACEHVGVVPVTKEMVLKENFSFK